MIKIERLRFRYIWSMMTRSIHECWHLRTNKCVRTNICKKSVFVVSVRNINICGRILIQFTGLLRTNTVAAKRNLLAERTGLGKSVSVSLRKNGPYATKVATHMKLQQFCTKGEGTGTRPDYLVNRDDQKNERPFGEKIAQKSKNSCRMKSRSCGYIGPVDSGPKYAHSWNQLQTLK